MKVCWAMDYDPFGEGVRGGGVFSTRLLIQGLESRGHEVQAHYPTWPVDNRLPFFIMKVHCARAFAKSMAKAVRKDPPDVLVVQNHVYPYVLKELSDLPSIVVARDKHYRCPQPQHWSGCVRGCGQCLGLQALLPYPWFSYHVNLKRKMLTRADAHVVPSSYIAQDMREWFPETDPVVVYPPLDDSHHPTNWYPRDVLFLGRGEYKGADIVLTIAEEMQGNGLRFRICGRQDPEHAFKFQRLPNVDYLGFVPRRVAFETAKIVVAPARWNEPAARNICEAVGIGIPCIISDRGGVPETMGPGGIIVDDVEDIGEWVGHIERLHEDFETWRDYSVAGSEHSKMMSLDKMTDRFERVLESVA